MIEYVTVKLCCLNDAFEGESNRPEVARIFHDLATRIERGDDPEKLMDINGNSVASVEYQHKKYRNLRFQKPS